MKRKDKFWLEHDTQPELLRPGFQFVFVHGRGGIVDFGLLIADFGFGIVDLKISNPQSTISNVLFSVS